MPPRSGFALLAPALLTGGLALTLAACLSPSRPLDQRLQDAVDRRVRGCDAHGASVAVALPDGAVWEGGGGVSHGAVAMTPEMAFAVGSITKNMVAALVLQLAEEGRLELDAPISKWIKPHPHVSGEITVRQLLDHSSGLFMYWDNQEIWDDLIRSRTRVFTPEDVLGYLREPYFAPGEGQRYSNTNYLLAAMIVTRVTGSTLAAEMRRRFWEPLGLESARLPLEEPYPEVLAHVWGDNFEEGEPVRDITLLPRASHDSIGYGSSGVFMTAGDLARWTHALYGGKVLEPASLDEMRTFEEGRSFGLGVQRFPRRFVWRGRAEGHGGGNIGTAAYMVHLPDHGVSLAVMVNRFGSGCASELVQDVGGLAAWHAKPPSITTLASSVEGVLGGLWLLGGVGALILAVRRDRPLVLVVFGGLAIVAGLVLDDRGLPLRHVLFPWGALLAAIGAVRAGRRRWRRRGGE